ncbi:prohibitin-like [Corapipo altera]|nr:prohibitin-like isoform X2 [Corapipo altera]XP_027489263.1 prohibitin-like [Corapipo altera]
MAAKVFESIGKLGLGLAVAGGVVNSALYNVDAGHRAVIFDRFRGVQDVVVGEGTHFLIPWVQKPIIFDCRSRPRNIPVITGSKGEPWHGERGTGAAQGLFPPAGSGDGALKQRP